ncbi:MAG: glycosyltransferase family 4 protein [Verrucomicrobia bacterium]|nr:glycosyltransferase family 4 protein [Verrucomicrobiota bacterium]
MRLLFVHERIGALGGAEANVLVTAAELRRRGHDVALAHGPGTNQGEPAWRDVFPACFPLAGGDASALERALAAFQPDVIYVHKFSDPAGLAALLAAGPPVVRMVHDHDMYCMRGYKYNPFTREVCRRAASAYCVFPCGASVARNPAGGFPLRWVSYADKRREIALNQAIPHVVVASGYMRDELLRNGFAPERIELHAPVPRSAPNAEAPSFGPRNLIVYAGQIIRGKGVDVLLEALAEVTAPFECVILGDGNHRAECERLSAHLDLQNRVTFAGFVSQSRIADYYREASLAVMSSLWPEPFGATGLEAMRCGLPVVAFDAGGIREWLTDGVNGYLIPWKDRPAFAARIDTLLADKALAHRLGEAGRTLAEERFGFAAYIDGLEDLFFRATVRQSATQLVSS